MRCTDETLEKQETENEDELKMKMGSSDFHGVYGCVCEQDMKTMEEAACIVQGQKSGSKRSKRSLNQQRKGQGK